jgi:hypothetical protein
VDQLHQTLEGKEGKRRKEKNGGKEEDEEREHFFLSFMGEVSQIMITPSCNQLCPPSPFTG